MELQKQRKKGCLHHLITLASNGILQDDYDVHHYNLLISVSTLKLLAEVFSSDTPATTEAASSCNYINTPVAIAFLGGYKYLAPLLLGLTDLLHGLYNVTHCILDARNFFGAGTRPIIWRKEEGNTSHQGSQESNKFTSLLELVCLPILPEKLLQACSWASEYPCML